MYHLMTVQTSKGNVPHTYKKLIKASAIKVTTILQSLEKKKICEEYFEKENFKKFKHVILFIPY